MKLLTNGCSFTCDNSAIGRAHNHKNWQGEHWDEKYGKEGNFPRWPQLLGEALNLEVVNIGISGKSNYQIYEDILFQIYNNPPDTFDTIAILWSNYSRFHFHSLFHFTMPSITRRMTDVFEKTKLKFSEDLYNYLNNVISNNKEDLPGVQNIPKFPLMNSDPEYKDNFTKVIIDNNITKMIILDKICKEKNIKLLQAQGTGLLPDRIKLEKIMPSSEFFKEFCDLDSFIGAPSIPKLGGWNVSQLFKSRLSYLRRYTWGPEDSHPNSKGHEKIAQMFLKKEFNTSNL